MQPSDATIAEYFCKGIETLVLLPEQARAWCDAVIAKSEEPPYAYIEVSLNTSIPELISALRDFPGDRDTGRVGAWLLAELWRLDIQSVVGLEAAIRKAKLISQHCGMADEVCYAFDRLDDALDLAQSIQYGTVDDCRGDFLACLQRYAKPFLGTDLEQPNAGIRDMR